MKVEDAIQICMDWFDHLERQRQKSVKLQQLAAMARQGPEQAKVAQAELRRIDRTPVVFDGARLEPAVRCLIDHMPHPDDKL